MEITIDFALVRRLAAQEYATAREEIAQLGPLAAYLRSQQRHDARLAGAADAGTLACTSGCSWCCHFTVDVRAVEALHILEVVANELTPAEQVRVHREIHANSALLSGLDEVERMRRVGLGDTHRIPQRFASAK